MNGTVLFESFNLMVIRYRHRDAFKPASYRAETAYLDKAPFGTKHSSWLVATIRSYGEVLHWHLSGHRSITKYLLWDPLWLIWTASESCSPAVTRTLGRIKTLSVGDSNFRWSFSRLQNIFQWKIKSNHWTKYLQTKCKIKMIIKFSCLLLKRDL